jgi:hypothetical protein
VKENRYRFSAKFSGICRGSFDEEFNRTITETGKFIRIWQGKFDGKFNSVKNQLLFEKLKEEIATLEAKIAALEMLLGKRAEDIEI